MNHGPGTRRLAAILAADVVGYSKMMAADEFGTLRALKRHHEDVFDPAVQRNHGRIFKLIGDGTLAEFFSVVDAMRCAVEVQTELAEEPDTVPEPRIRLRIGVNLGDVILDGDDVYGDGVNIAARLEPLAPHGGLCVSSIVHESVGDRVNIALTDSGEVAVKNIVRPLRIWTWHPAQTNGAPPKTPARQSAPALPQQPDASIAVLPFDNMSGDPEQEYFSDGISEDIITDLSKVGGLTVISRNSSFAYKGKTVDARVIGRELGVQSLLEGSIRRAGNRVRITAQLIGTEGGAHLWAERFDRDLTDIFEVQDEVTREIVAALKLTLSPKEEALIASAPTRSPEAHDCLLRARQIIARSPSAATYAEVVGLLERAIELDPDYADARAALALVLNYDRLNRWSDASASAAERSLEQARRAVEVGPDEASAHYALSVVLANSGNLDEAARENEAALALNPNFAHAHNVRGVFEIISGRPSAAVPHIEGAIRIDPASNLFVHFLGLAHLLAGHHETAATAFRHRIMLFPETDLSRALLASTLGHLDEIDEAQAVWAELREINPAYSLDAQLGTVFFRHPGHADHVRSGLAAAGLPPSDDR